MCDTVSLLEYEDTLKDTHAILAKIMSPKDPTSFYKA